MKKLIFLFIAFISLVGFVSAQTPNWLWAAGYGGKNNDTGNCIAVDGNGNIYLVGSFDSPTITFGSYTLTNSSNSGVRGDIYIVKFDMVGNVLWAKSAGNTDDDVAKGVAVDIDGNIIVTGDYGNLPITFGSYVLNNAGSSDIFLVKYDPNGNVIWAKNFSGAGADDSRCITTDNYGYIYIAGDFNSPSLTIGSSIIYNSGLLDFFIAKFNSNGNAIWAKRAGGTNNDYGNCIAADLSGNIYSSGYYYSSSISFGAYTLNNSGSANMFLVKYDSTGNVLWAINSSSNTFAISTGLTTDISSNVYVAGNYNSADIIFGNDTLNNVGGGMNIYLIKYSPSGNIIWSKNTGAINGSVIVINDNNGNGLITDKCSSVYMTGEYTSQNVIFGTDTINNNSILPNPDIYIAQYDTNGNVINAYGVGGKYGDQPFFITSDNNNNIYLTGGYDSNIFPIGNDTLTNSDGTHSTFDIFIAKHSTSCNCIAAQVSGNTTLCEDVKDTLHASGGISYLWSNNATTQDIIVNVVHTTIYTVTVTGSNGCTASNSVVVAVDKPTPTITCDSSSLICNQSYSYYQWYLNGVSLSDGQHDSVYSPITEAGVYYVVVTDSNGCKGQSNNITITITSIDNSLIQNVIYVYPNPASDNIIIESSQQAVIKISNMQGQMIKTIAANDNKTDIDVSAFPSGVYVVEVKTEKGVDVSKFVKE